MLGRLALIIALCGCSSGERPVPHPLPNDPPEGPADDVQNGGEDCTPSPLAERGIAFEADAANVFHATYYEVWLISTDVVGSNGLSQLEIFAKKFRGSLAAGFGLGLFRIAGDDADPNSCTLCVTLEVRAPETGEITEHYIARKGELSVSDYVETGDAEVFDGALSGLELVPFSVEAGRQACEYSHECPGVLGCDSEAGTCRVATVDTDACPVSIDLVEL